MDELTDTFPKTAIESKVPIIGENLQPQSPTLKTTKLIQMALYVVGAFLFLGIAALYYISFRSTPKNQIVPSPTASQSELTMFDSAFIQFTYPKNLYVWSFGRGVSLEYFQINSVPADEEASPNRASIFFDMHVPQYTDIQTLDDARQDTLKKQKEYPWMNFTMKDEKVDEIDALVIESIENTVPSTQKFYTKKVWVRKNNVVYEIELNVVGDTNENRDALRTQYDPIFENIVNSVKLKSVDPVEVERLGNHPD